MPKFRKKPVVIEAAWFSPDVTAEAICAEIGLSPLEARLDKDRIVIPTLEGHMTAMRGDWIIRGVKGEFYPCKADIFAATYELVKEGV